MEYKLVVVVRKDLGISHGKIAVQVAHAAVDCALALKRKNAKWFKQWHDEGQRKVVVKVESLEELLDLSERAKREGLTSVLIQDAGLTQVPPGTITVLGIGPAPEGYIDAITGDLPLL